MKTTNTRGGHRDGAGRKPCHLKKYLAVIRCTPAEWEYIKTLSPEQRAQALIGLAQANNAMQPTGATAAANGEYPPAADGKRWADCLQRSRL